VRPDGRIVGHHTTLVTYNVVEYDCEHCGKPFTVVDSGLASTAQRYCTDACRQAAYRKRKQASAEAVDAGVPGT
jgi:hypothetical protein